MNGSISSVEISIYTAFVMVIIDAIVWYFEKNKRHLHTLEFWFCYLTYFIFTFVTKDSGPGVVALPTILWIWRTVSIRKILSDVCGKELKRNWHMPFLISSYVISGSFYFVGLSFSYFTFPCAFANFLLGMLIINESRICLKVRDRITPVHVILLFTVFIIFTHQINLVFFRYQHSFAEIGFAIVLLTTVLMAIILPAVTVYELQRDQRQQLEKILKERIKQLIDQSKFSALGEMTAGIVHEINNPLCVVRNRSSFLRTQVLRDKMDKELLLRNLDQIEITSERMLKIVNSLRRFSRNSELETFQPTSVATILEDTLSYCSDRFYYANIALKVEPYTTKDIECKSIQISQVLLNLLNNSFEAVKGTKEPWVKIHFVEKEKVLQIRVVDSGPGISLPVRQRMMEPFFSTKPEGGTGLGLSISLGIIEDHHGSLYYDESAVNTTFVVELPYRQGNRLTDNG